MTGLLKMQLTSIEDVKEFVELNNECSCEVTVRCGTYVIDGKSLMGLFSLNLSNPIIVEFEEDINGELACKYGKWVVDWRK